MTILLARAGGKVYARSMFIRSIFLIFALLPTMGLSACKNDPGVIAKVEAARERNDGPAIWVARDRDSALYLYGAVHLLPAGGDWLRDDVLDILASSGTVFFETPRDQDAVNTAAIITQRDGYQKNGRKLSMILDGYNSKRLLAAALNAGLDYDAVDRMQPWLLSDLLVMAELEAAGLKGEFGADSVLHERARTAGKYVRYLETMEEHLEGSTQLPDRVQLQALYSTFDNSGDLAAQASELARYWSAGHTVWIWDEVIAPLKAKAPDYYAVLFTQRNERWAAQFDEFMKGDGEALAVVGVGHLVGEDSVVEMLRARGYQVERYFAYRGDNVIKTIDLDISPARSR